MYVCPEKRKETHHHWPMEKKSLHRRDRRIELLLTGIYSHIQGPRTHPTWNETGCKMMVNLSDKHERIYELKVARLPWCDYVLPSVGGGRVLPMSSVLKLPGKDWAAHQRTTWRQLWWQQQLTGKGDLEKFLTHKVFNRTWKPSKETESRQFLESRVQAISSIVSR